MNRIALQTKYLLGNTRILLAWMVPLFIVSPHTILAYDNPAPSPDVAARGVLKRLLPRHSSDFLFETVENPDNADFFEIDSKDGKIVLRGPNAVCLCSALNWYLKYFCLASVSWSGNQLNLPDPLPIPKEKIHRASPHQYRYFFNYCCFGYSLPWWDWQQWERLIDWMALHGINMPLAVTGQEVVWRDVMRKWGMDDREINIFLAGPPYLPFGWMGCLDGWGGPLPKDWIDRHADLQNRILARERELGMTPVLQGFTGHVPRSIHNIYPDIRLQKIQWVEWETSFVDPSDPHFQEIGKTFVDKQTRNFGTDHLYASDAFIEMTPPSNDPVFLRNMAQSIYAAMNSSDTESVWVMQGWIFYHNAKFWKPEQTEAFLNGVPDNRMILLDLFCDDHPVWQNTKAFCGKPWLWCILQNFGNTIRLSGPLPLINTDLHQAMNSPERGNLRGIGIVQEGLDYNPIVFDFMTEMAWHSESVDLDQWVRDYCRSRYGQSHPAAERAWTHLRNSVYASSPNSFSRICARPQLAEKIPVWTKYDRSLLFQAWKYLLESSADLEQQETYRFDLTNVTRQALSNLADPIYIRILEAWNEKNRKDLRAASNDLFELIRDLDKVLSTREEFLLGRWLEDAKRWGNTQEERAILEWNARNVLTLWGGSKSELHDYARKEWGGLLSGFYLPRWKMFLERLDQSVAEGTSFDADTFEQDIQLWEDEWTRRTDSYPSEPEGNTIEIAQRLFDKHSRQYELLTGATK